MTEVTRSVVPVLAMAAALAVSWAPSAAQSASAEEIRLLEAASQAEAAGELDVAERLLHDVLEQRGASVPALLSLERVLRIQGRLEELPPLVVSALEDDRRSALLNRLLVRTYSELDRVAELEAAAEQWIETVPRIEVPYREVSQVWQSRGEYGRARSVLEEGRRRIEAEDALALELGDLYAAVGEPALAVGEWGRSIDRSGRGLSQVRRRLRSLPDGGASLVPELVDLLAADSTATGRADAALELAVDAGLEERARAIARRRLPGLTPAEQRRRLEEIARRADAAGHNSIAYWGYQRLVDMERGRDTEAGRFMALRNRLAELALELGDPVAAAANYQAVEDAFEPGSPQRGQAAAARIELLAAHDPESAREALSAFRVQHPESPETDRLSAAVARALLGAGREGEAAALVAQVDGPRSAVLRGRLMLVRGDVDGARRAMMSAAPSLRGVEATGVLSLVTLLGRVSDAAGALVGEALNLRDQGEAGEAVDRAAGQVDRLELRDRPVVLDFAARIAEEAGLDADARVIRRRLLEDYPRSQEAPGALLALARDLSEEEGSGPEARELLERLIIEYPRSALVPQARRALDRLERRGVATGAA